MRKLISSVLNARPEEERRVILLLSQGFFTGIALASFDVGAVSVFLETFSERVLAWAFVASGATGIIFTYLYSVLQLRLSFKKLVILYQSIILVTSILLFIGIRYDDVFRFIAFVLALPFTYLGILMFWGTFNRLFDIKSAKRLIGGIDTGQLVASIISLFLLGFLLDLGVITPVNLFEITAGFVFLATIMFLRIGSKFQLTRQTQKDEQDEAYPVSKILKHPYVRLMALFVIVSMIAATFIDFAFLNVTKVQWQTEAEIGAFIARFEATVVIFSFLFQTFVTDYIIDNFGLKAALLINPILLMILSIGAFVTGIYVTQGGEFIFLFVSVALVKLFVDSLRDALDGPSFKLYFLPIPSKIRFDVNTKVEGVISSFAAMVAGIFLILMDTYYPRGEGGSNLIYLALLIVPLILLWFFTTQKMHNGYRSTLKDTLASQKNFKPVLAQSSKPKQDGILDLKVLEQISPSEFEAKIKKLSNSEDEVLKDFALKSMKIIDPDGELMVNDDTSKKLASEALELQNNSDLLKLSNDQLYALSKSREESNRILVTKLMLQNPNEETVFILNNLLRDVSLQVKKNALLTARKLRRSETFPILIDLLDDPDLSADAATALIKSGNSAIPNLISSFNRGDTERSTQIKIVDILCQIGTREAQNQLWELLDFPDRRVFDLIVNRLSQKDYNVTEEQTKHIIQLIEAQVYRSIWNLAAVAELQETDRNSQLRDALEYENKVSFARIFKLLSVLYEHESLELVKENLEVGSRENNTYALELLDLFVSGDLKMKLFPLLEDSEIKEKLVKLEEFFSRVSFTEFQTLNYIISKNLLDINRWTRACALDSLIKSEELDESKLSNVVMGQMFNTDPLIYELATLAIYKNDQGYFESLLERIPEENRRAIMKMQDEQRAGIDLLTQFQKVNLLSKIQLLQGLPKYHLSILLGIGSEVDMREGRTLEFEPEDSKIIIVLSGSCQLLENDSIHTLNERDSFLVNLDGKRKVEIEFLEISKILILDWKELVNEFSFTPDEFEVLIDNIKSSLKQKPDLIAK